MENINITLIDSVIHNYNINDYITGVLFDITIPFFPLLSNLNTDLTDDEQKLVYNKYIDNSVTIQKEQKRAYEFFMSHSSNNKYLIYSYEGYKNYDLPITLLDNVEGDSDDSDQEMYDPPVDKKRLNDSDDPQKRYKYRYRYDDESSFNFKKSVKRTLFHTDIKIDLILKYFIIIQI